MTSKIEHRMGGGGKLECIPPLSINLSFDKDLLTASIARVGRISDISRCNDNRRSEMCEHIDTMCAPARVCARVCVCACECRLITRA